MDIFVAAGVDVAQARTTSSGLYNCFATFFSLAIAHYRLRWLDPIITAKLLSRFENFGRCGDPCAQTDARGVAGTGRPQAFVDGRYSRFADSCSWRFCMAHSSRLHPGRPPTPALTVRFPSLDRQLRHITAGLSIT